MAELLPDDQCFVGLVDVVLADWKLRRSVQKLEVGAVPVEAAPVLCPTVWNCYRLNQAGVWHNTGDPSVSHRRRRGGHPTGSARGLNGKPTNPGFEYSFALELREPIRGA